MSGKIKKSRFVFAEMKAIFEMLFFSLQVDLESYADNIDIIKSKFVSSWAVFGGI